MPFDEPTDHIRFRPKTFLRALRDGTLPGLWVSSAPSANPAASAPNVPAIDLAGSARCQPGDRRGHHAIVNYPGGDARRRCASDDVRRRRFGTCSEPPRERHCPEDRGPVIDGRPHSRVRKVGFVDCPRRRTIYDVAGRVDRRECATPRASPEDGQGAVHGEACYTPDCHRAKNDRASRSPCAWHQVASFIHGPAFLEAHAQFGDLRAEPG